MMAWSRNVLPYVGLSMLMIDAASMTLASTSGASERENLHVKDKTKFMIFFSATLVTHFLIVMVVLLDFHGQRMCQGHHSESD